MMAEVLCPNCRKKLAEGLAGGVLTVWCRRCGKMVCIDRRVKHTVN